MRCVVLYRTEADGEHSAFTAESQPGQPPVGYGSVEGVLDDMCRSGVLLASEGLLPSESGARVRIAGGRYLVTEGPFPEADGRIAGFALVQVRSREEAIEWARRFVAAAGAGEAEIRPLSDVMPADPPTPATP